MSTFSLGRSDRDRRQRGDPIAEKVASVMREPDKNQPRNACSAPVGVRRGPGSSRFLTGRSGLLPPTMIRPTMRTHIPATAKARYRTRLDLEARIPHSSAATNARTAVASNPRNNTIAVAATIRQTVHGTLRTNASLSGEPVEAPAPSAADKANTSATAPNVIVGGPRRNLTDARPTSAPTSKRPPQPDGRRQRTSTKIQTVPDLRARQ